VPVARRTGPSSLSRSGNKPGEEVHMQRGEGSPKKG